MHVAGSKSLATNTCCAAAQAVACQVCLSGVSCGKQHAAPTLAALTARAAEAAAEAGIISRHTAAAGKTCRGGT
jgi:hypothetical protein